MGCLHEMKGALIIGIIVFVLILIFGILIFSNSNSEKDLEKETQGDALPSFENESNSEIEESAEEELIDIRTSDDVFNLIDESVELLG